MLLSRSKSINKSSRKQNELEENHLKSPTLESFLAKRDFVGAITFLEYNKNLDKDNLTCNLWLGYCYFHLSEYKNSLEIYQVLYKKLNSENDLNSNNSNDYFYLKDKNKFEIKKELIVFMSICEFMLGEYTSSQDLINEFNDINETENDELNENNCETNQSLLNELVKRLELHLSNKLNNEQKYSLIQKKLKNNLKNQLCLASIYYLKANYQEAIDIYKKCLLNKRDLSALPVYLALCYYKLDYYDVSQEVLNSYLDKVSNDSLTAINLRACNHYKLFDGRSAKKEFRELIDNCSFSFNFAKELLRHNLVVFQNGESALKVLPSLIGIIPEAKLNLIIYYLKKNNIEKAYNLIEDLKPNSSYEYILKAIVNSIYFQIDDKKSKLTTAEHLKKAKKYFQIVGSSASECDTILGRQCMASCFFLMKQFDDVLIYLNSIKSYFYNDDTFNFNYGQAKLAIGNFKEAKEALLLIKNDEILKDPNYISILIRCYIITKKPKSAWIIYEKHQNSKNVLNYLNLIANDCYKMGYFYFSVRAFDLLEKIDGNPEYFEGKRGALCGLFQMVIAGKESKELLLEIIEVLENSNNQKINKMIQFIKKWIDSKQNFILI